MRPLPPRRPPDTSCRRRADFLSGARSGINVTPTFFVNGQRYDGWWEPDVFLHHLRGLLVEGAPPELP